MTPTNTEALAARLESGWCPIESPADMEQAAAALRRLSAERDALRAEQAQAERRAIDNPWRASLENCISGDNYLRASEYRELIAELDEPYRLRAAPTEQAAQAVPAGFVLVPVEFIEAGQRVAQEYARTNPKWPMWDNGEAEPKVQDPCGVHAWLEQAAMLAAATAAPEAQDSARTSPAHQPVHGWTDADADAARLALELECLLTDGDVPMPVTSRWWESAHEALALHRQRLESELSETRANVDKAPAAQSATVEEWERGLSAVMPADFKDWWQNSKREWPAVAAEVIRSLRKDRDWWREAAGRAQRQPLTEQQIMDGWRDECPPSASLDVFTDGVRFAERAHGIGATTGEQR